jgi:hypothetical protein
MATKTTPPAKRREAADASTDTSTDNSTKATGDAEQEAEETAKANPLLAEDATVDVDGALAFAADVRALVDELGERLVADVVKPLSEFEQTATAAPAALVASSRRLRGHVDDLQRDLRALSAAAAALGQDAGA